MKSKRGFTLVELVVVLAVSLIVTTMVLSMVIALSKQLANSKRAQDHESEISEVFMLLNTWCSLQLSQEGIVSAEGHRLSFAQAEAPENVVEVVFTKGNKTLQFLQRASLEQVHTYFYVQDIAFNVHRVEATGILQIKTVVTLVGGRTFSNLFSMQLGVLS